ncbi:hypothetical protein PC9H_011318 [Pleurotus ostreatus]|uniref:LIM zinc-binding domain-containing protein n=1 Tax=Pleurotus ostreatus TaxID=5322 RepID=A0A8H6ZLL5_PLEOS|nr:uncharacterized protein PC9H_011318 [Pleurotus ostreatus]KAF7420800.1 hypothetical protein PC9H_011318 [Pleurotus ostreatus]KAJ8690217.1 hypothetical protein PTI98_011668 [Pleurotus ostreatus]
MHPFTGTSVCPKCLKAVYAAEQVMGPGRMLYHKPCLACTMCNKRLDSLTLLEHNHKPYCKLCHVKHFGTKDLRQANLPYMPADSSQPPPLPPSPMKSLHAQPSSGASLANPSDSPIVQVDGSPTSQTLSLEQEQAAEEDEERDTVPPVLPSRSTANLSRTPAIASSTVSATAQAPIRTMTTGGFPTPHRFKHRFSSSLDSSANNRFNAATMGRSHTATGVPMSDDASQSVRPLVQTATGGVAYPLVPTATGTRYGIALGGSVGVNTTGSPNKRWSMGTNPTCPKCSKMVYFAEQVKAIGKTYHKGCLRCTQCNTSLDSTRLTENDGEPFCRQCYGKIHGPRGGGYALLGKAGG